MEFSLRLAYEEIAVPPDYEFALRQSWPSLPGLPTTGASTPAAADDRLIPKPEGELNRPGRGGYSLKEKLADWEPGMYDEVQVIIALPQLPTTMAYLTMQKSAKEEIRRKLRPELPYREQVADEVDAICEKLRESYPILRRYEDDWAGRDFIKGLLKNSARERKRLQDSVSLQPGRSQASPAYWRPAQRKRMVCGSKTWFGPDETGVDEGLSILCARERLANPSGRSRAQIRGTLSEESNRSAASDIQFELSAFPKDYGGLEECILLKKTSRIGHGPHWRSNREKSGISSSDGRIPDAV
ncbi:hypothetical protein DFP72DRAFT_855729 [Ephemerocybe angulata]|uniref:Uncharacterized protein n=1 Tax=Ephemerocybe angulata TaxID=980116 RepID=A0A8H6LW42_9AGAR|nr:hypothetical protein DFP72DRAFT_855729 [Tulosesus angulatus]